MKVILIDDGVRNGISMGHSQSTNGGLSLRKNEIYELEQSSVYIDYVRSTTTATYFIRDGNNNKISLESDRFMLLSEWREKTN